MGGLPWEGSTCLSRIQRAVSNLDVFQHFRCFSFQAGLQISSCRTILHAGGCDRISNCCHSFQIWVSGMGGVGWGWGADVMCALSLHVDRLFWFCRLSADRYPKLGEYYALLKDRPSIKASWPPHWLENLKGQDDLKDIWQLVVTPQPDMFVWHRLFCWLQLQLLLDMIRH